MSERAAATAVVTGGASGIGHACVLRLAAEDLAVAVVDRDGQRGAAVVDEVRARGGTAEYVQGDVADADAVEEMAARIEQTVGPVSVLVTSAGILHSSGTLLDMKLEEHDRLWRINYHGTVHCCRAFGRRMAERGRGAIVTLGSTTSFGAFPLPAYCPSKTAILRLTEILAVELGRFGVRVNGVAPTYTLTPAMQARIDAGERDPEAMRRSGALDMFVEPHHVADAVAFLCSEQAAAIAGVMLRVDAGWLAATSYKAYAGGVPWAS